MPGGPSTWHVLDWDQRRIIAVTIDDYDEEGDVAIEHLKKHIHALRNDVYAIRLSPDGDLVSTSNDSGDDETTCPFYPPLEAIKLPGNVPTVSRSDLLEVDRLAPNVDLVSYAPSPQGAAATQMVFKYYFLAQFALRTWSEMCLWLRLPPHPNIVPFDRLVLDELRGRPVGFTTRYVPGGTVDENLSRPFKLKYLRQLLGVADDLNLKYGVAHQDIAARNLLVDPETDNFLLFDFNFSGQIGGIGHVKERSDVKGVIFTLYEIITRDLHFRSIPHECQDTADVERLEDWVQHPDCRLDHPVAEYRSALDEWVSGRRAGREPASYAEASEPIEWTLFPDPPSHEVKYLDACGNPAVHVARPMYDLRRTLRDKGAAVLNWERPAQATLREGDRVFADGRLVRPDQTDVPVDSPKAHDALGETHKDGPEDGETDGDKEHSANIPFDAPTARDARADAFEDYLEAAADSGKKRPAEVDSNKELSAADKIPKIDMDYKIFGNEAFKPGDLELEPDKHKKDLRHLNECSLSEDPELPEGNKAQAVDKEREV